MLAGIINRMDRAYLSEADCGEIRLIYRLTRTDVLAVGDRAASPRLPMTLNLVLKARNEKATDDRGAATTCARIARRSLAAGEWPLTGAQLAEKLTSDGGPLDLIGPENIDRIETNLQIAHAPKSPIRIRTDYLLKVFDFNTQTRAFEETPLENQIDRERILTDDSLRRDFKAWLLEPTHFSELDRGTVLIPKAFLATRAIAPTPAGFSSSDLQPAFGLVQGDGAAAAPVFTKADVVGALEPGAKARHRTAEYPFRWRALSAGSMTSHARAAIKPAASAGFVSPASTRWRPTLPTRPWCRARRISSATRFAAAIS